MTVTYAQAIEFFKACKEAGKEITVITDTDEYAIYKVEAPKEIAEIHFYRTENRALIFRSAK